MEFRYQGSTSQEPHVVRVIERLDGFEVCIGERRYHVMGREVDQSTLDMWVDGRYQRVRHAAQGDTRWVALNGGVHHLTQIRHRRKRGSAGGGEDTLTATMPGQIMAVLVKAGDEVQRGQTLVLMEAMKMELRVVAPDAGIVANLFVSEGEAVERGQTLVELQSKARDVP
ncbi:MAG: biotin/lipoyl-containing protein [Ardenticatenaceae bacterium]